MRLQATAGCFLQSREHALETDAIGIISQTRCFRHRLKYCTEAKVYVEVNATAR